MDDVRLYNTMSRTVDAFAPADGQTVRMYTCGPTVYNAAHLGNFRTFLFEDLLRRTLRLRGWSVFQVMNLTDVDDKIIAKANATGTTISAITDPVIKTFHADRTFLKIEDAQYYPRATAYIPQMIALVERLLARGLAYRADDGSVYFAIDRFPAYGRLSRLDKREVKVGARVAQDDYSKENAQDFALWKAAKPEDERVGAAWDAPHGRGRPGWHLECSAMALTLLGETFDLHCGGVDLIFPHHEDEIAQSEGATGKTFARHWCHGEFLQIDGAKMAKRVGNVMTIADLKAEGVSAAAVRHLVFNAHYRQVLNLSDAGLVASQRAVSHIGEFAERLDELPPGVGATPAMVTAVDELERRIREALFDDLNSPQALAAVFDFLHAANADLDRRGRDQGAVTRAREAVAFIEDILGIVPPRRLGGLVTPAGLGELKASTRSTSPGGKAGEDDGDTGLTGWVEGHLRERLEARAAGNFTRADAIRDELHAQGIAISDTGAGTKWKKVR